MQTNNNTFRTTSYQLEPNSHITQYINNNVLRLSTRRHMPGAQHIPGHSEGYVTSQLGFEAPREWQVARFRTAAVLSSLPIPLLYNRQQLAVSKRVWSGSRQSHKQTHKHSRASKQEIKQWENDNLLTTWFAVTPHARTREP